MSDSRSMPLLHEAFGSNLLGYLLAVDPSDLGRYVEDGAELPGSARELLPLLLRLAERVAAERLERPGFPISFVLNELGAVNTGAETSVGNLIRLSAGGSIADPAAGAVPEDTVKAGLRRLGRDAYPQLLAPRLEAWYPPHLSFYLHPARAELEHAVHGDPALSRIFPSEDDGDQPRLLLNSLGRGDSAGRSMFGERSICNAWDLALMTDPNPSLTDLYTAIDACVDTLRSAARGDAVQVRSFQAFTGISTAGRVIATPWGLLRPITEAERQAAPRSLQGLMSTTDLDGNAISQSYAGEVILDTTVPFAVALETAGDERSAGLPWPIELTGQQQLRRQQEGLQLGVLLATRRRADQWATARPSWQWIFDPSSQGRLTGWWEPKPGFIPAELSSDECDALERWCEAIEAHWQPRIDVAVRRVLSAAQERTDPGDRLVDSVIAWESLFGTREGEPTLRISAAMAWLLGATTVERSTLQAEIKRLYAHRSKIVHGETIDQQAIGEKANRALELAVSSLRALFSTHTGILALRDGSARSIALMLGSD